MILRILIFVTLVYFIYRILNTLFSPLSRRKSQSAKSARDNKQRKDIPPPYDPAAIEDIDYKEVNKNGKDDLHSH